MHGEWPKHVLDHINRDTLDNRIDNLREATQRQNSQNTKRTPKGCFKQGSRYYARIRVESGTLSLGGFDTEEEATEAYQKARQRLHTHYVD